MSLSSPTRNGHVLDVRGDFACFSQPLLSVERYSYPCPTPSAARNLLDAIYLKPEQFRWQVRRIEILNPVAYIALRRNEVKETVNAAAVEKWMRGEPVSPILADADKSFTGNDEKGRTQRQTMALRDVRYRIYAEIMPWPGHEGDRKSLNAQSSVGRSTESVSNNRISAAVNLSLISGWPKHAAIGLIPSHSHRI